MEPAQKVESFFKGLLASIQVGKIYTCGHPRFDEYLDKTYSDLSDFLTEKSEMIIGIIGDELAFEREIFFDLSRQVKVVIDYLKSKGIERMAFYRGVTRDELRKFILFLMAPPQETKTGIDEQLAAQGIKNIIAGKIKTGAVSQDQALKDSIDYLTHYRDSVATVSQSMENIIDMQSVDAMELKFTIISIMENLVGRYVEFFKLAVVKEYDSSTFSHVLNVSILSMYFASRLGFARPDCVEIGIAGLFHDIGKVYISRKIIQKADKLTDAEFSSVRSHTFLGAEILLKYVDTLGVLPVVVAFEHHLKYNLQGYPKIPFKQSIHIASQIISLCDVYDALTSRRSYKRDYPPELIYEIMQRERGGLFSPELLDKFFSIMGVWPIGTIVRLSGGDIAVVRSQNEVNPRAPNIEIVGREPRGEIIDLRKRPELVIEGSLNPLSEGKKYVAFI